MYGCTADLHAYPKMPLEQLAAALLLVLPAALAAPAAKPSIIHIVADDLGFNDIWQLQSSGRVANQPNTVTPNIMALIQDGIALTAYHTYKVCAPSRASIMTGRYPWGVGYYDMKGTEAVPLGFKLVAELLQDAS
jgi:arylsulfatase A-like enzyme